MPMPREILNELKWREDRDISRAEIWYVHRGAPDDTMIVSGEEIEALEHSFMVLADASIPYHRIFRIIYEERVIFERK
ncbi:MAG: DUF504 domain-containing protein [Thermoplasmata archaeon]|nr:MAG: DUF504 domain-containing protein [Thermoplasmata archaeon]